MMTSTKKKTYMHLTLYAKIFLMFWPIATNDIMIYL